MSESCAAIKWIAMAIQTKLKLTTSFFRHHHYSAFKGNRRHDKSRQLDYFLTEGTLSTKIIDAKQCDQRTGCRSDHLPVELIILPPNEEASCEGDYRVEQTR